MRATYVALLRGINVGGKNIIPMRALATTFERLGLDAVRTYIQSGNVLFQSRAADPRALEARIEAAVKKAHRCDSKVVVRSSEQLHALVRSLPRSWTKPSPVTRYYVIFLRHTIDSEDILDELPVKREIEDVTYRPGAVLWSVNVRDASRSGVAKFASTAIYKDVTIRNLNTTLKLDALAST